MARPWCWLGLGAGGLDLMLLLVPCTKTLVELFGLIEVEVSPFKETRAPCRGLEPEKFLENLLLWCAGGTGLWLVVVNV